MSQYILAPGGQWHDTPEGRMYLAPMPAGVDQTRKLLGATVEVDGASYQVQGIGFAHEEPYNAPPDCMAFTLIPL